MAQRPSQTAPGLIDLIKQGDEAAFAQLFREHAPALNDFAFTFVKSADVAEDVVQDVFIRLWDNRKSLAIRTSITVYLYRATRNAALDRIKHDKVASRYAQSSAADDSNPTLIDSEIEERDMLSALESALDALPERAGEVLRLRIEHGLTNAEVAEVMGISVKGVERARWRALEALRKVLKPYK